MMDDEVLQPAIEDLRSVRAEYRAAALAQVKVLSAGGMTPDQIAERIEIPVMWIKRLLLEAKCRRVLVCGDWHGDIRTAKAAVHLATGTGCDAILHVGDLGILWPNDHPRRFDQPLSDELAEADLELVVVDGNHDNHAALRALKPMPDGFVDVLPSVRWAPRAHRWTWGGVTFAAMGGAYSVDRQGRVEGKTIWKGIEEVQPEDVELLGTDPVDVLVTHDVPYGVPVESTMALDASIERDSAVGRHLLRRAVENVLPRRVFAGHWHQRLSHDLVIARDYKGTFEPHTVRVDVLDMNGRYGNAVILDLPGLAVTEPEPGWHTWTRRGARNQSRKENAVRFHRLVEEFKTDGLSESDARNSASEVIDNDRG